MPTAVGTQHISVERITNHDRVLGLRVKFIERPWNRIDAGFM
jgi:hypothetical protein